MPGSKIQKESSQLITQRKARFVEAHPQPKLRAKYGNIPNSLTHIGSLKLKSLWIREKPMITDPFEFVTIGLV